MDYKEPTTETAQATSKAQAIPGSKSSKMEEDSSEEEDNAKFKAFTGTGYTLKSPSGKSPIRSPSIMATTPPAKPSTSPMTKIVNKYAPVRFYFVLLFLYEFTGIRLGGRRRR